MTTLNIEWPSYFFRTDFTEYKALLESLELGAMTTAQAEEFIAALSLIDTGPGRALWNNDDGAEWSLKNVEVIYNGLNKTSLPTLFTRKYALGLLFPADGTAPVGRLYLTWNDPVVETVEDPVTE